MYTQRLKLELTFDFCFYLYKIGSDNLLSFIHKLYEGMYRKIFQNDLFPKTVIDADTSEIFQYGTKLFCQVLCSEGYVHRLLLVVPIKL